MAPRSPIQGPRLLAGLLAAALVAAATPFAAHADDPVFRIEFNDGKMTPQRIEVPANTRFKLELVNSGTTPAEFESTELRKEKVIAPGVTTSMVIKNLDPGEYHFFDDFHLDTPPALLVVK
jgi:heme/copper-type cytochrome/quinol oxidase subunit 2